MQWSEQDISNCGIGRALEVVGRPWALLIVREVSRGLGRFDEIQRHLAVSAAVLSRRLDELVESQLLARVPYQEAGRRTRYSYQLTSRGVELYPILLSLKEWGDRHRADPAGPATVHRHADCGGDVHVALVCDRGHQVTGLAEVDLRSGPGARPRP
ncbi:DNA-binding HxlR family transcriptional regulator [Kitasatospora sp. MAP12-15]|uniref:winged helix-turn-helix transcriptional regulator n=1 Tax=unclassified Kitasatospora TaxID=2633591 RepID=UPI0024750BA9|nr:helix-turn-helix domain-containing protein [Kitasatospora sp. MAP12-44]MDH6109299.1 DNA-binding HxlR family transcriptional regulator [Kitasatospora sp. MAP12-44]